MLSLVYVLPFPFVLNPVKSGRGEGLQSHSLALTIRSLDPRPYDYTHT